MTEDAEVSGCYMASESEGTKQRSSVQQKNADLLWKNIVAALEDTLQLGFLEEIKYVAAVVIENDTLILSVPPISKEAESAYNFLSQANNTNRILILAKRASRDITSVKISQEE